MATSNSDMKNRGITTQGSVFLSSKKRCKGEKSRGGARHKDTGAEFSELLLAFPSGLVQDG